MRNSEAMYRGKIFDACHSANNLIILRSKDENDILKFGFKEFSEDKKIIIKKIKSDLKCINYVRTSEIEEYYDLKYYAEYMGHMAYIMSNIDDELIINIDNLTEEQALHLKMDERYERHSHIKTINKKDVIIHVEKKLIFSNKSVT